MNGDIDAAHREFIEPTAYTNITNNLELAVRFIE